MKQHRSFALGYSLVFHSILTYFIFGAFTTSGMNVWIPAFCGAYGWNNSVLLSMATLASLIGVIGSILFGQLVSKRGPGPLSPSPWSSAASQLPYLDRSTA